MSLPLALHSPWCRVASIAAAAALHSRSEPRACSGTLNLAGWHRSPPLWAEIDANVQPRSSSPARRTALSLRAASVQWRPLSRGGIDRRRLGRRSMRTCNRARPPLPAALHSPWCRVASIAAALGGDRCERATALVLPCPPHCTLAQSSERAVAPALAGWHRSPPPWAEIDANVQPRSSSPARRTALSLVQGGIDRRRSGRRSMRTCNRARPPLPAALHSRSEQRACSGARSRGVASIAAALGGDRCERATALVLPCPPHCTLLGAGWHRSPPLWAEIDANVQPRSSSPARRTALSLRAASVQWRPLSRGGIDRRRPNGDGSRL